MGEKINRNVLTSYSTFRLISDVIYVCYTSVCDIYTQGAEAVSATAAAGSAAGEGAATGEAASPEAQYGTGTSASSSSQQLQQPVSQLQQQHQAAHQSQPHSLINTGGHFQKVPLLDRGPSDRDNRDLGLFASSSPQRRPLLNKSGVQSSPALVLRGRGDQGGGGGSEGLPPSVHYIAAGSGKHSCGPPSGPHGTVAPSSSRPTRESSAAITDIGTFTTHVSSGRE